MKKLAHWLLAASPAIIMHPVNAADFQVSDSIGFQNALSQAAASPENDTITLASGTVFETINSQPFSYNATAGGSLRIEAETGAILDGAGLTEVLSLSHDSSGLDDEANDPTQFSLLNITIRNGKGSSETRRSGGLAVYGANTLVEGSNFENNTGAGGYSGAAIYFDGERNYTLTVADTTIKGNEASSSTGGAVAHIYHAENFLLTTESVVEANQGNRGVIYLDGSPATISGNTLFKDNVSTYSGMIDPTGTALVQIQSGQFINNEITDSSGTGVLGFGNYQIEDSLFENNRAPGYAVLNLNGSDGQYIKNSRFINNQSQTAGTAKLGNVSNKVTVHNSLFQGNTVDSDNGVVECSSLCEITNAVFADNLGGASVYARRTTAADTTIANSVFLGSNTVVGFSDSNARATLYNNYLDTNLLPLNQSQLIAADNIENGQDAGLDTDNYFSPLAGSVLIDAGTTDASKVTVPETDILGNARVAGASVDIGWEEFGSSNTTPVITNFELISENATNLDLVQFRLEYELAEQETDAVVELMTDETEEFETISLDNNIIEIVFMEGGLHSVTVKVTAPNNEYASQDLSFQLDTLDTLEVIDRIEASTKDLCASDPLACGIDTDTIRQEGYDLGEQEAIASCVADPESCGVDINPYLSQGREEGKQLCIENPSGNCGIEVSDGAFDTNLLPNMGEGWALYGTGQDISNLDTVFAETTIVWALQNDEWHAFSADAETHSMLEQNEIPTLQTIPASSGFWVKK